MGLWKWDSSGGALHCPRVGGSGYTTPVGGVTYYYSIEFELQVDQGTQAKVDTRNFTNAAM